MKLFRKIIFWSHLVVGLFVALIVLLMSATGVLLTYERQLNAWTDTKDLNGAPSATHTKPVALESLITALDATDDGLPRSITRLADTEEPLAASYGRQKTIYLNRYSGEVLGERTDGLRPFFRTVTNVHRWLAATGDNRALGRAITGACNLGFLFLVVSGFYLWWPRTWRLKTLRNSTLFKRGLSPKARDFNWHNVIGFWSLIPLFVVVLSGVVISYPWASDLVYTVVGEEPPPGRGRRGGPGQGGSTTEGQGPWQSQQGRLALDALVQKAEARAPGWRSITLQVPAPTDTLVNLSIDSGTGGQPQKRAQIAFDWRTGETLRWMPFEAGSAGQRARSILRFAHTGEVLGLFGQTLAGLVSLGALFLVWTGIALSWRRFWAWRKRKNKQDPQTVNA